MSDMSTKQLRNSDNEQLTLRIPKDIHQKLKKRAKEEKVSLNYLMVSFISKGVGVNHNGTIRSKKEG